MNRSSLLAPLAPAALLASALFAVSIIAQAPQTPPAVPVAAPADHDHDHPMPAPTNLQVLPKNLTGEQVHEIMESWEAALGAHCSTCHAKDPNRLGPNGRPVLNFADDSKPEKATARLMYKLTENINQNYISKIDNAGDPVTCGTCHRGHLGPEPFKPEPEDHVHPATAVPAK